MTDSKRNKGLGLGLLNGAVLLLIGALVLITPLLPGIVLTAQQRMLDNVAGGLLLGVGVLLLMLHFAGRKTGRHDSE